MKYHSIAAATLALSALIVDPALAQMANHRAQQQTQSRNHETPSRDRDTRGRGDQSQGQHYYNGRWVDSTEWQRHSSERDRWASRYQQRRGTHYRYHSDSSGLVLGIIGFALGAAIVGSQQQAQHAQSADDSWDNRCAAKYHSYDRNSRTYLGYDGARHYCQ